MDESLKLRIGLDPGFVATLLLPHLRISVSEMGLLLPESAVNVLVMFNLSSNEQLE